MAASSSEIVMRDLAAKQHAHGPDDPASHPLASEEWLGSCILAALADPCAVCRAALINKNFCAASRSDLVWQKLLPPPPHLESLFKECDDVTLRNSTALSKKDLYIHLCKSISLGGGLKRFWLDEKTGGECYMLSARSLAIAWGDSPEYWGWQPCSGAWFPEVAFLRSVCWFDISGKFQQLLKPGSYVVSFRMQMRVASIWQWSPIKISLQNLTYAQPPVKSRVFFHRRFPTSEPPLTVPPTPEASQPSANDSEQSDVGCHVWLDCDVGEFTVEENEDSPVEVEFSMREVEFLGWKRGFLLDGVMIRPSYVVDAQDRPTVSMGSIYGYRYGDDEGMNAVENGFNEANEGGEVEGDGGDKDDVENVSNDNGDDDNVDDGYDDVKASDDDDDDDDGDAKTSNDADDDGR